MTPKPLSEMSVSELYWEVLRRVETWSTIPSAQVLKNDAALERIMEACRAYKARRKEAGRDR